MQSHPSNSQRRASPTCLERLLKPCTVGKGRGERGGRGAGAQARGALPRPGPGLKLLPAFRRFLTRRAFARRRGPGGSLGGLGLERGLLDGTEILRKLCFRLCVARTARQRRKASAFSWVQETPCAVLEAMAPSPAAAASMTSGPTRPGPARPGSARLGPARSPLLAHEESLGPSEGRDGQGQGQGLRRPSPKAQRRAGSGLRRLRFALCEHTANLFSVVVVASHVSGSICSHSNLPTSAISAASRACRGSVLLGFARLPLRLCLSLWMLPEACASVRPRVLRGRAPRSAGGSLHSVNQMEFDEASALCRLFSRGLAVTRIRLTSCAWIRWMLPWKSLSAGA